jgi:putative glutamine amidotransferase
MQALNVWCGGTLIQDIPTQIGTAVDHSPGRAVTEAHPISITPNTRLAAIAQHCHLESGAGVPNDRSSSLRSQVNSSHHQSIHNPGDNLIVSAVSPQDNVIEAVELQSKDHFVIAIQWHPERTYDQSALSRAIFHAFVEACESWTPRRIEESVLHA